MSSFTESNHPFEGEYDADSVKDSFGDSSSPIFNQSYGAGGNHDVLTPDRNGGFSVSDGPILPDMGSEEGHALREWRR